MTTAQRVRGPTPTGRFVAGLAMGVLTAVAVAVGLLIVLVAAIYVVGLFQEPGASSPEVSLVSNGANISRGGGVNVRLDQGNLIVRQRCSGACDDLELSSAGLRSVRILDRQGQCIACRRDGLFFARADIAPLSIAGRWALRIEERLP